MQNQIQRQITQREYKPTRPETTRYNDIKLLEEPFKEKSKDKKYLSYNNDIILKNIKGIKPKYKFLDIGYRYREWKTPRLKDILKIK